MLFSSIGLGLGLGLDLVSFGWQQGRTRPTGSLAFATWAGWSAGQVGRHVKWWTREWNGAGGPGPLSMERGLYVQRPQVYSYATVHGASLPNYPGPVWIASPPLLVVMHMYLYYFPLSLWFSPEATAAICNDSDWLQSRPRLFQRAVLLKMCRSTCIRAVAKSNVCS